LLLSRQVDVLLLDEPVATYYMKTHKNLKIPGQLGHRMDPPDIGFAFRKGDVELQKAAAECIRNLKRDGKWNTFLEKWFQN
jgi:ABC-type amino acid transport substrate-binding protein